jgi:hypothetical protein
MNERVRISKGFSPLLDHMKRNLDKVVLPYFKNMKMDAITPAVIEAFLDSLIKQKYKNTTINGYYGTFKTMMIEAIERGIIAVDLTAKVERLINDRDEIKIIPPHSSLLNSKSCLSGIGAKFGKTTASVVP